jgi:hypothetical protein
MDKSKIAEWLLSLVMEPAQAASVVGDLLEANTSHSIVWFWTNLIQMFAAAVWRSGREQPLFLLSLAVRGTLVQAAINLSAFLVCMTAGLMFWHHHFGLDNPMQPLVGLVYLSLGPICAGRWIARRALGKEVAVCIAMTMVSPFIEIGTNALWILSFYLFNGYPQPNHIWWLFYWWEIGLLIPYLLGAFLIRHRLQRAAAVLY